MTEIRVNHVSKTFHTKDQTISALKDVNLQIMSGDIFGIIGMSGAGKSTLVRCLNYLERPDDGEVWIREKNLGELTDKQLLEQRRKIGMIFQNFNLLSQNNVIDNVSFPLRLKGMKKAKAHEKAREFLKLVGLQDKEKAYPSQLSGGQKQRVAIARALALEPEILLCDEATSALDPKTTASILDLLREINEKMGITIVLITHQMQVVQKICRHMAIMGNGMIVEKGEVERIFYHPKSKAIKAFTGESYSKEVTAYVV